MELSTRFSFGPNVGQPHQSANLENLAYLPHNAYDDEGKPLPVPSRQPGATMATAQVQLLQLSTEQMRAASGQQNSNFGIKSEASSGVGIQRLKAQGEIATFHFPDNLARALRYEDIVLIDLVQKYFDTKRVVRILGINGKAEKATLDPGMEGAYAEEQRHDTDEINKIFNPTVGRYDVTIDTGPSYQTMRQEAADRMIQMTQANPALMQVAGDLVVEAQDFPMSDKLADRLRKTIPPQLLDDQKQQIPPQIQQQMQQMQQVGEQLHQALQAADAEVEKLKSGQEFDMAKLREQITSAERIAAAKHQVDIQLATLQAQADITMEQIKAGTSAANTADNNDTKRAIADLNAVESLIVAHIEPPPALQQEVAEDFAKD